jgi:hypothetical protein
LGQTNGDGAAPAGTWRCMGNRGGTADQQLVGTLWLRIS